MNFIDRMKRKGRRRPKKVSKIGGNESKAGWSAWLKILRRDLEETMR